MSSAAVDNSVGEPKPVGEKEPSDEGIVIQVPINGIM